MAFMEEMHNKNLLSNWLRSRESLRSISIWQHRLIQARTDLFAALFDASRRRRR